ncbi:MAG: fatty acid desaturase, partial [Pseudomonadota bacterium]
LLAATMGVWLFFVQHQFEETQWDQANDWNRHEAALHGSSHYDLPTVLRWFTGNIGIHHVHHLSSKIPFFQLKTVLDDHPVLYDINRITLRESFSLVNLSLWDSKSRKLVTFSEAMAGSQQ